VTELPWCADEAQPPRARDESTAGTKGPADVSLRLRYAILACLLFGLLPLPAAAADGDFQSRVRAIRPSVRGLELSVIGGDEQLKLRNETGRTVIVEGYDREPYLRFKQDGTVERNRRSPATYINQSRSGGQQVPLEAIPENAPQWEVVARGGSYTWYDHRIHFTKTRPPPAGDGQTKIFDWTVPMRVDGRRVKARGSLFWESASSGGFPWWLAAVLAALAVLAGAGFAFVRHRRARPEGPAKPEQQPAGEAW
jgi:hypothetical protein